MHTSSAMKASPAERARVIATLTTAFTADPFIRWLFPGAQQFLACFPQVLSYFAGGAFEHDSAYRTADFGATALWLPPGVHPDEAGLAAVVTEGVAPQRHEEVFGMLKQVGASHPEVEHWYLAALGVDLRLQGQGYGSALLALGLEACDQSRVAAYLETANPANLPFYGKFGFEVIGQIQVGGAPSLTRMLRAAR